MAERPAYQELKRKIGELERKNAALEETVRSLKENELLFRALYENAPVMIASFRQKKSRVLWNRECERRLGWTTYDIKASPDPLSLFCPDPDMKARLLGGIRRCDGEFREFEVTAKDGSTRIQLWASFRLPTGTVISLGHDVTEVKRAEEALRKGEQDFRDLIENFPSGIAIVVDEKVVYRNTAQQMIFGRLPETYFPSLYDQTHPDDIEGLRRLYQAALSGRVQTSGTEFRHYPSGDINDPQDMRWIHFRVSPIEYRGMKAVLFNMIDVTKAREMERLLTIQDRMASLGHVAAGIAHEIRSPLSGINIYLNALKKLYDRGELDTMGEVLEKIASTSSKIEAVIKRVMDFSKPSEPKRIHVDIRVPVEEALSLSSVMLRKSGIEVKASFPEGLPLCYVDPQLLEQVVLNLITNAVQAMEGVESGKRIEVSTSLDEDAVAIAIADSGPGVPPHLRQKIFDPFYTTKSGSTGIGLSLSHRIIQDHGGTLSVSASRLGGAEFVIRLPIPKER
ncbi:MAG TPA: PAS domain S-box protein [Deltaproteobacteria bacterium]|jgi:PAS domain S-box-containing protein|nr:PAS domain S-box protein [Deltaproteobacteria bacterium]HOI07446.1 PAS domain S-box protein [Deltaproteobacteria bacterium]